MRCIHIGVGSALLVLSMEGNAKAYGMWNEPTVQFLRLICIYVPTLIITMSFDGE